MIARLVYVDQQLHSNELLARSDPFHHGQDHPGSFVVLEEEGDLGGRVGQVEVGV